MTQEFIYRRAGTEDSKAIMDCIAEEYGSTYFREEYYNQKLLQEAIAKQKIVCFIAEDEYGNIAATSSLTYIGHFKQIIEISAGVVRKQYRNYPIFEKLLKHQIQYCEKIEISSIILECVTNHPVSQFLSLRHGFIPVSMMFNYFYYVSETEKIINKDINNGKILMTCGICMLALKQQKQVKLHLPKEHLEKIREIYNDMKIEIEIQSPTEYVAEEGKTELRVDITMKNETANIWIEQVGKDFQKSLGGLVKDLKNKKVRTINAYVNMERESTSMVYEACKKEGFIFVGILPNTCEGNFTVMTHLLGNEINTDKISVIGKFEDLYLYMMDAAGLQL